jgi:oligosaccharide repeat unit polymerase
MLAVSVLVFIFLTGFNYYISGKKITYPPLIFCFIWLVTFLVRMTFTSFYLQQLRPLHNSTYLLLITGGLVATIAGFISLSQYTYVNKQGGLSEETEVRNIIFSPLSFKLRAFLTVFVIGVFPLFINYIVNVIIPGQVENVFKSIRYETAVNEVSFGVFSYFVTFSAFVALLNGYVFWQNKTVGNRWLYIISFFVSLIFAITTMGRTSVLMTLSFNAAIYFISVGTIRIGQIIRYAFAFVILFLVMGVLLDKGGSLNEGVKENANSSIEMFGMYMLTPANALDTYMHTPLQKKDKGMRSLRFFYVLADKAGIIHVDNKEFDLLDEFLFVPYPVNVYTFYNPYIRDFGVIYALIILFLIMLWHSANFIKASLVPRAFFSRIAYCYMFYPLLMVFFNDQYMSVLSSWIQLFLYAYIFYGMIIILQGVQHFFIMKNVEATQ